MLWRGFFACLILAITYMNEWQGIICSNLITKRYINVNINFVKHGPVLWCSYNVCVALGLYSYCME